MDQVIVGTGQDGTDGNQDEMQAGLTSFQSVGYTYGLC